MIDFHSLPSTIQQRMCSLRVLFFFCSDTNFNFSITKLKKHKVIEMELWSWYSHMNHVNRFLFLATFSELYISIYNLVFFSNCVSIIIDIGQLDHRGTLHNFVWYISHKVLQMNISKFYIWVYEINDDRKH